MKKIVFISFLLGVSSMAVADINASPIPQHSNGAWVYDPTTPYTKNGSTHYGPENPGALANSIKTFNASLTSHGGAESGYPINQIFSYGSDLEMENCLKASNGNYEANAGPWACTMTSYYDTKPTSAVASGEEVTAAYKAVFGGGFQYSPIIDGRVDTGWMRGFNSISQKQAQAGADQLAKQVCGDDNVDGIQLDIEPFSLQTFYSSKTSGATAEYNGQYYFYQELSKDFAGGNSAITTCVDSKHPNGRYFSVFTYASMINSNVKNAFYYDDKEIGYIVDSLYDLGPLPGGRYNDPTSYATYVKNEVSAMKAAAAKYGLRYQLAIPYAASVHEYEGVGIINPETAVFEKRSTGYKQSQYVSAAWSAIQSENVAADANFIGVDYWAFEAAVTVGNSHNGNVWGGVPFYPNSASDYSF